MTKKTKEELQAFLLEWIYFRSCYKESSGPKTRYYPPFRKECEDMVNRWKAGMKSEVTYEQMFFDQVLISWFCAFKAINFRDASPAWKL